MKKRVKSILLVIFSVIASLFLFAGCELGETLEDALASRDLTVSVTYYANGGTFTSNSEGVCKLYYKGNTIPLNIGAGGSRNDYEEGGAAFSGPITAEGAVVRAHYEFLGWYHAEKDADGKYVKYGENGNVLTEEELSANKDLVYTYKATDEKVDFTQRLAEKGDYIFIAQWNEIPKFVVELVCDNENVEISIEGKDELQGVNSLKHGDFVRTFRFDDNGKTDSIDIAVAPFQITNGVYTLINYYQDEACTQPLKGIIERPADMTEDKTVYLRVATGKWTVVRSADDYAKINWKSENKYWIANNIDASKKSAVPPSGVNCEIQGNGFTIDSMTYSRDKIGKSDNVSLFGEIGATAKIENLFFTNLKIEYEIKTVPTEYDGGSIFVVFTSLNSDAKIKNVSLNGTMSISKASTAGDLDKNAIRKFGGYDSDEAYISETNGQGFVSNIAII